MTLGAGRKRVPCAARVVHQLHFRAVRGERRRRERGRARGGHGPAHRRPIPAGVGMPDGVCLLVLWFVYFLLREVCEADHRGGDGVWFSMNFTLMRFFIFLCVILVRCLSTTTWCGGGLVTVRACRWLIGWLAGWLVGCVGKRGVRWQLLPEGHSEPGVPVRKLW